MAAQSPSTLDPRIGRVLADLRRRIRRYVTIESILAVIAVLLSGFWIGLLLDRVPPLFGALEMPRSARAVVLGIVVVTVAVALYRLLVSRLFRTLPDKSMALLLERHHPQFSGRLMTAVELSHPQRSTETHSSALLEKVAAEAAELVADVDPRKVFRTIPLRNKGAAIVPMTLALIALAVASPATVKQGLQRLLLISDDPWPRRADLRMVGVEVPIVGALEPSGSSSVRLVPFQDNQVRVAKGGAVTLRIEARDEGAEVPEVCTVYYRSAGGVRGQVNMRRSGRVRDGYQSFVLDGPPLAGIADDLVIHIQGLDDRLDDFQIFAVDAPSITSLQIEATYPPYLRTEGLATADLVTPYQPGLRIREGSSILLRGTTGAPLARVEAAISDGDGAPALVPVDVPSQGQDFSLRVTDLRQGASIVMVPFDQNEISAPSPSRYFLGVVADAPPEVQFRLRGIGPSVTAKVRIPIEGIATDDYGVSQMQVQLAPVQDALQPVHSESVAVGRDGNFETTIDIRDLTDAGRFAAPQPGDQWLVYGEASDAYDLGPPHVTRTNLIRVEIVTPDNLLAALERRELALRMRLEQLISETKNLRDGLDRLRREGWSGQEPAGSPSVSFAAPRIFQESTPQPDELSDTSEAEPEADRALQVLRLRIQQADLQTAKTGDELTGIVAAIDDIILEMQNNRVDTPDRIERLSAGVRNPLGNVVSGSLFQLRSQIFAINKQAGDSASAPELAATAVQTSERVILELTEILEQMLDLESYNEVLDMVRGLIEQQESLIEATEDRQQKSLQDLFREDRP